MREGKALCIDYGKKRIGVATGDFGVKIAFPKEVFENRGIDKAVLKVASLVSEFGAMVVVVGYPLDIDEGRRNFMMGEVEKFCDALKVGLPEGVEIVLFDEALSSFEAKDLFKDARKNKIVASGIDDSFSAQIILQRYFDSV